MDVLAALYMGHLYALVAHSSNRVSKVGDKTDVIQYLRTVRLCLTDVALKNHLLKIINVNISHSIDRRHNAGDNLSALLDRESGWRRLQISANIHLQLLEPQYSGDGLAQYTFH